MVYYLVFQGKNMFKEPLTASDIFLFGEFQDSVSLSCPVLSCPSVPSFTRFDVFCIC